MSNPNDQALLRIDLEFGIQKAVRDIATLDRKWKQATRKAGDVTKHWDREMGAVLSKVKEVGVEYASSLKLSARQLSLVNKQFVHLDRSIKNATKELENKEQALSACNDELKAMLAYEKRMAQSEEKMGAAEVERLRTAKAASAQAEADVKSLRGRVDMLRESLELTKQMERAQGSANYSKVFEESAEEFAKSLKDKSEDAFRSALKDAASHSKTDMGKGLQAAFSEAASSLRSRDFSGLVGSALSGGSAVAKGAAGGVTRAAMQGAVNPEAGAMAKSLAGMASKLGPLFETLAKIGPIVGAVAGSVLALVKLFLDADAAAKEFNKELLSTASTGEFLAESGGDSFAAYDKLEKTLKGVRDAANDFAENNKWGITKKDHLAVLNVLNAEGVSFKRMETEAANARKEVGAFSADMVHVAVGYSRIFGVSLNEIASFQSEMMTDLGMSFQSSRKEFQTMQDAAGEAGMAQNRFFATIKSVSSDLALYNMRIEDSVHLLTMLGKTMNPRNAAKFMQETVQGFKGMGRSEKLKMTLLAGEGYTREVFKKDRQAKIEDIAGKISAGGAHGSLEDIKAAVAKGGEAAESYLKDLPKELQGTLREGVTQLEIDNKRAGKGVFGLSGATGNFGMGSVLDMYKKAITRFSGGDSLEDAAGSIGGEMMAEQLGVSQERLDAMIKLEKAVNAQKNELVRQGKKTKEQVAKMGTQDILQTMDKDAQERLKSETNVESFAQQQAKATISINDQLGNIMDWLMNQFYNLMSGMYDAILDIPGVGGGARKRDRAVVQALNSGGNAFSYTAAKAASGAFTGKAAESARNAVVDSPEWKQLVSFITSKQTDGPELQRQLNAVDTALKGLSGMGGDRLQSAMTLAGISKDKMAKLTGVGSKPAATGSSIRQSMRDAGLSYEEVQQVAAKLGWTTGADPKSLVDTTSTMAAMQRDAGIAKSAAGAPSTPVTAVTPNTTGPAPKKDEMPATVAQADATKDAIEEVRDGQKNMKLDPTFTKGKYKDAVNEAVLDAIRIGLYEYWMYSGLDKDQVIRAGLTGTSLGPTVSLWAGNGKKTGAGYGEVTSSLAKSATANANAVGGTVLNPAPGEVLASVAPGETIVPKGGFKGSGGSSYTVNQTFSGPGGNDTAFARFIDQRTRQALVEWERAKSMRK